MELRAAAAKFGAPTARQIGLTLELATPMPELGAATTRQIGSMRELGAAVPKLRAPPLELRDSPFELGAPSTDLGAPTAEEIALLPESGAATAGQQSFHAGVPGFSQRAKTQRRSAPFRYDRPRGRAAAPMPADPTAIAGPTPPATPVATRRNHERCQGADRAHRRGKHQTIGAPTRAAATHCSRARFDGVPPVFHTRRCSAARCGHCPPPGAGWFRCRRGVRCAGRRGSGRCRTNPKPGRGASCASAWA